MASDEDRRFAFGRPSTYFLETRDAVRAQGEGGMGVILPPLLKAGAVAARYGCDIRAARRIMREVGALAEPALSDAFTVEPSQPFSACKLEEGWWKERLA